MVFWPLQVQQSRDHGARPGWHWSAAEIASTTVGAPRLHPVTLAGQQAWHGPAGGGHGRTALWAYGPALVTVTGAAQHAVDAVMAGIIKAMTG
jgi:hypothetical protein